jgi:hypothetical protein
MRKRPSANTTSVQGNGFAGPNCAVDAEGFAPHISDAGVAATSEALKAELDQAEASDPLHWDKAQPPAQEEPLRADVARIVEKVFINNAEEVYDKLETAMRVGERRSDHGALAHALDEAETNARMAHRLWITIQIERKRWELENEAVHAAMRTKALEMIQREKDAGRRSKVISKEDVDGMAAMMHPDEWKSGELKRAKLKATEENLENLAEMWTSRCKSLQVMLSKSR